MAIPEIKLTPEDQRTLEGLAGDIAALEREIAKLERIGADVGTMKTDLARAKKLREGLLKEYGR
jgi:hypothetical protein